jgi:hypothetical protein
MRKDRWVPNEKARVYDGNKGCEVRQSQDATIVKWRAMLLALMQSPAVP